MGLFSKGKKTSGTSTKQTVKTKTEDATQPATGKPFNAGDRVRQIKAIKKSRADIMREMFGD
jgi:hypothetical protein